MPTKKGSMLSCSVSCAREKIKTVDAKEKKSNKAHTHFPKELMKDIKIKRIFDL